jgi:chemotaxis protein histidine kinase CheA
MPKDFDPLLNELRTIADRSKNSRLTTEEEQKGVELVRDLLSASGKALAGTLELFGSLPWFIPVNGTIAAWPKLSQAKRRAYLAALKDLQSDPSTRIKFSLARGLYKVDSNAGTKLILETISGIRGEKGLDSKDRRAFFNVLLGKGKPWLSQIELKTLKQGDAQLLTIAAIECAVGAGPASMIPVVEWAKAAQLLDQLPESVQQEFAAAVRKWNVRWRKRLDHEGLPPLIAAAVQVKDGDAHDKQRPPTQQSRSSAELPAPKKTRVEETRPQTKQPEKQPAQKNEIAHLLKQLEVHFQNLRNDLQAAKNQLRQAQQNPQQLRKLPRAEESTQDEVDQLRHENARLSETVKQLQETLSELANEDFDHAVSRKADTDEPVTDPLEQFKSLLGLRLRERLADFQRLNPQQHVDGLPLLLETLLQTLQENGIDLSNLETPVTEVRKRY